MRIVKLTAENVKRLRAVEIEPDGTVQVVTGRNAQGKSSVLDAMWLALGGGAASRQTARPIRDGEDHASVTLDLGDLVVTRTWTGDRTTLTVTNAEGTKHRSPQAVLDALVGRLSFDPLAFTHLSDREQVAALLDLVTLPFDLADLDQQRAAAYEERTLIGRELRQAEGHLAALPEPAESTPDAEVSPVALFAELRAAQDQIGEHERAWRAVEVAQSAREAAQVALTTAQRALVAAQNDEGRAVAAVRALPEPPDTSDVEDRITTVDEVNTAVRAKAERARASAVVAEHRARYDAETARLAAFDREKAAGLAAAEFPIDGLGFDAGGVTYRGVPFAQASSAEQIRVSLAMAMALNPKLRVVRILDGSLLDADNLALIAQMARERDYQVWIERVSDTAETAVVIEDGQVAA